MKYIFLFVSLFLILSCEKKDLTDKEILEIIHADKNYQDLQLKSDFLTGENFIDSIKSFRKIVSQENLRSIYKADLNNDGKLDYLVNLKYKKGDTVQNIIRISDEIDGNRNCVVVLSSKTGYEVLNAAKGNVYDIYSSKIVNFKGQNLIKVLNFKPRFDDLNNILQFDTLLVRNNQLTEFVNKRSNNNISEIKFTQFGGYAPGVYYTLSLKNDSTILDSKFYKKLDGNFIASNKQDFENLALYLNNIDFKNLKDKYFIECSDCSAIETKIVYDNGKVKTIYDYGERGSLGLVKFYDSIHAIMEKHKWEKIE